MKPIFLLVLLPFCLGCLWDRDTLAEESEKGRDTLNTLVGWFDRYPPEYYRHRLDRVLAALKQNPGNLDLYDDAAVALDRLHRSSEAIEMMERKLVMLRKQEASGETTALKEHRYRYLANLGTFHAHDWIGRPKEVRDADLDSLETAKKLIAAAIDLNPDAHFGREKYQLLAIEWLLETPNDETAWVTGPLGEGVRHLPQEEIAKALEGFLGMIRLGAAWESIDFFRVIEELLSVQRRGSLATVAELRVKELEEKGRTSLHPLAHEINFQSGGGPDHDLRKDIEEWYPVARRAADERQESRWSHLRQGLAEGRHPDTDPDFWKGWEEPDFPTLPGKRLRDYFSPTYNRYVLWIAAILFFVILWIISLIRRTRKARAIG